MRKVLGYIIALAVATIPLQRSLLNVEQTASPDRSGSNMEGTLLFILLIAGTVFAYWLIDSANAQKTKEGSNGHG